MSDNPLTNNNTNLQDYINKQQEKTNNELWGAIEKIREKTDRIPAIETKLDNVLKDKDDTTKRTHDYIKSAVMIGLGIVASAVYNIITGQK